MVAKFRGTAAIKNQDVASATFVVGNDLKIADFADLQTAMDNLPPEGGSVGMLQGTFDISTTLTLPAVPVKIVGSGIGATVIAMGANAIAAFTIPAGDNQYTFQDLEVTGDSGLDNRLLDSVGSPNVKIDRVNANTIRRVLVGATPTYALNDCVFTLEDVITTALFTDHSGASTVVANNVRALSVGNRGGSTGFNDDFKLTNCVLGVGNLLAASEVIANDCEFLGVAAGGGVNPSVLPSKFSGCFFDTAPLFISSIRTQVTGCQFSESRIAVTVADAQIGECWISLTTGADIPILVSAAATRVQVTNCNIVTGAGQPRAIDLTVGVRHVVADCVFQMGAAVEAVQTVGTDSTFTGNTGGFFLEAGAADRNRFSNNQDFGGSTIIGGESLVENENFRNVKTWGATGDGATDDTAAIQAAADALPSLGGVLYFPEGNYIVSTTITLPSGDVHVKGAGRRAAIINIASNVIAAFTMDADSAYSFSYFTILGNNIANQIGLFFGANIFGTFDTTIDNVDMEAVETHLELNPAAFAFIYASDCRWDSAAATGMTLQGAQAFFYAVNCHLKTGGFLDNQEVHIVNCEVELVHQGAPHSH